MKINHVLKTIRDAKPVSEFVRLLNSLASTETKEDINPDETPSEEIANQEDLISKLQISNKILMYNIRKFHLLLDNLNDGILVLDHVNRIIAINHIMEQLINIRRDNIMGKHLRDINSTNPIVTFIQEHYESIHKLMEKTEEITVDTATLKLSYKVLIDGSGNICGSIITARDITAQKLAEAAKIELITHISHELKTFLITTKDHLNSLTKERYLKKDHIIDLSNTLNEEIYRLEGLINNLLNLSKIEMGGFTLSRTMVRTREFLENIFHMSISQKKKDLNYEIILPDHLSPINIDKELMGVALMNIISNGIKYTPEQGKVTLRAEEEGDRLIIHITDTGIGISEEELPHIFDKFYRSSDKYVKEQSGHGLGLAMAKAIIKLHDGELMVESKKGEGTHFTIYLPVEERYFIE